MIGKLYRVYGVNGHRQRASFGYSAMISGTRNGKPCTDVILRQDSTGTNDYVDICIFADSERDCMEELQAQLDDGFMENCRYEKVVEL